MKKICIAAALIIFANLSFAFPQRIISTMPNITEIVFALNLGDRVVGVTQNCNYPPEAQKKEKIGRESINLEKVFSLNPDLIIML
ncbi:MAG: ABC transporter substrate-binding protein, partial [Candidatus Margulisiibacteriota bacterium]